MFPRFLMSPLAPWLLATLVLAVALALWRLSRRRWVAWRWALRGIATVVAALGIAMALGAGYTAVRMWEVRRATPPPGVLVTVQGTRLHVWCEGTAGGPSMLLLPGGYGQGLWFRHLQRDLASNRRVCLIDRPGLGWSEPGPLPVDTEVVVAQMREALEAAGEPGPLVIVGHSFGGLYAATFAALHPAEVAGLVLLDPTAPRHLAARVDPECPGPNYVSLLGAMFGLGFTRLNPMHGPAFEGLRAAIGDDWERLVAFEVRASALLATNSALNAPCRRPLSVPANTPARLGDVPVLVVAQPPTPAGPRPAWLAGLSDYEYENLQRHYAEAADDYVRMSRRARREESPRAAGHDFPHTERAFTLAVVRRFLDELARGTFPEPAQGASE